VFEEPPPATRHNPALQKITQFAQRFMFTAPDDNMVEHFDFEQLSGPNLVAGHFDVRLRRLRLRADMIVNDDNAVGGGDHGSLRALTSVPGSSSVMAKEIDAAPGPGHDRENPPKIPGHISWL
jgi:hypothetical protein